MLQLQYLTLFHTKYLLHKLNYNNVSIINIKLFCKYLTLVTRSYRPNTIIIAMKRKEYYRLCSSSKYIFIFFCSPNLDCKYI